MQHGDLFPRTVRLTKLCVSPDELESSYTGGRPVCAVVLPSPSSTGGLCGGATVVVVVVLPGALFAKMCAPGRLHSSGQERRVRSHDSAFLLPLLMRFDAVWRGDPCTIAHSLYTQLEQITQTETYDNKRAVAQAASHALTTYSPPPPPALEPRL